MSGRAVSAAGVEIAGLSLRLGAFALRDIDLALAEGETLVILGPNGAGKSVSLEAIAGFHRLERGRIEIAGRAVTRLPPERRRVSLMFQNFGLFPHLTVAGNAAIGSSARRDLPALLERFRIAGLADRYPQDLSPGQKQRVALARAFAARPDLFLFDEPFSAIDAPTRERLRDELKGFLREVGTPAIFVTHDRADANALADRIAILDRGRIVQSGSAGAVMARPADAALARFLGVENILPATGLGVAGGVVRAAVAGAVLRACAPGPAVGAAAICIRAEEVGVLPPDPGCAEDAGNRLPARIEAIADLGPLVRVRLDCGFPLVAHLSKREARRLDLAIGRPVLAEIAVEAVHLLAADDAAAAEEPGLAAEARRRNPFTSATALLWRRRRAMASVDGGIC